MRQGIPVVHGREEVKVKFYERGDDVMSDYTVSADGTAIGPDGVYLLWCRGWHGPCVSMHDSLEDALATWFWRDSDSDDTPESIEGPAGIVPDEDVQVWLGGYSERRDAAVAADASRNEVWTYVFVRRPVTGEYVEVNRFRDPADAHRLVERLGVPGRVLVSAGPYNESADKLVASAGGSTS